MKEFCIYTRCFVRKVEPDMLKRSWVDDEFKPPKQSLLCSQGS